MTDKPDRAVPRPLRAAEPGHEVSDWSFVFQFFLALGLAGFLVLGGLFAGKLTLLELLLVGLILALPVAAVNCYFLVIRRSWLAMTFKSGGLVATILGWQFLLRLIIFLVSLAFSLGLLMTLSTLNDFEWLFLGLMVPVFLVIHRASRAFMRSESAPWLVEARSCAWAAWLTPVIMVPAYGIGLEFFGEIPLYATLEAARAAQNSPLLASSSVFLRECGEWFILLFGYRDFLLGHVDAFFSHSAGLLFCVLSFGAVFFNVSSLMAFIFLPPREYRRLFGPLSVEPIPPKVSALSVGLHSAFLAIFLLALYLPGAGELERWAMARGATVSADIRQTAQVHVDQAVKAVIIGGRKYRAEILNELEALQRLVLPSGEEAREALRDEINRIFDGYLDNVDSYLDWYYSLAGEYARLKELLVGQIEKYMLDTLTEKIGMGVDLGGLVQIAERYQAGFKAYKQRLRELLAKHELGDERPLEVLRVMSLDEIIAPLTINAEMFSIGSRLGVGTGVGLGAGVAAAKIAQKTTFKLAAKALLKMATAKGAAAGVGALGGTAAGAALGSVIPGPGTVIGAGVGLAVGVIASLTVEKGLLSLEEIFKREDFKKEITEAINESRKEALAHL